MRRIAALSGAVVWFAAVVHVAACEDGEASPVDPQLRIDGAAIDVSTPDRTSPADVIAPPADGGADAADAADALPPVEGHPIYGVWSGVYDQTGTTYPLLMGLVPGRNGQLTGVVEYPTLGCGGSLIQVEDLRALDGGVDAASFPDAAAGASWHMRFDEFDRSTGCVPLGDVQIYLKPDGQLVSEWRYPGTTDGSAVGPLDRVGSLGPAGTFAGTTWASMADGGVDGGGLHPFFGVVTQEEPGKVGGMFSLLVDPNTTCGGLWNVVSRTDNELVLVETYPTATLGCNGVGAVRLRVSGAQRIYERRNATLDGGQPADGGDVTLTLDRVGP